MLCNKKYFSKNDADLNAFVRRLKFLTDCDTISLVQINALK